VPAARRAGKLFQANLNLRLDGRFGGSAANAYGEAAAVLRPAHIDGRILAGATLD